MTFRSRAQLVDWVSEFHTLGYPQDGTIRVIEQDGSDGAHTGLVAVQLSSGLSAYVQPSATAEAEWIVTIEARESSTALDAASVSRLSAELGTISALCAFLQAKSADPAS